MFGRRRFLGMVTLAIVAGVGAGTWLLRDSGSSAIPTHLRRAAAPNLPIADSVEPSNAPAPSAAMSAVPAPTVAPVPSPRPPPAPDERAIMSQLRAIAGTDPRTSLELVREGDEHFPDSADAPERAWFGVRSLVDLSRFTEAQHEARAMVARYPQTPWALDVQRHLLTHPLDLPEEER
jgi:hypothetical protein